jgi:hypothetical protein
MAMKSSFLATKSVSLLISTSAPTLPADISGNHAFGGDARCCFRCLAAQLDAQDLFRTGQIAFGFGQCLLAFHHWCIGLGAQFANHCCSNSCHVVSPNL